MTQGAPSYTPDLLAAGIDVADNVIRVELASTAPGDLAIELAGAFGDTVVAVAAGEPIISSSAGDIRSGLLYGGEWTHGSNGLNCTAGYAHAVSKTSGASYEFTAGHCGPVGTSFVPGLGGTRTFGKVIGSGTYGYSYTTCDCNAVGGLTTSFTTNQVLTNSNAKFTYTHTGAPYAGEATCHTGASSYEQYGGIRCGYVTAINQAIQESGSPAGTFTLADCIQTNVHAQGGDSGAPYGDGTAFLGIPSASSGSSQSYFSKASNSSVVNLNLTY